MNKYELETFKRFAIEVSKNAGQFILNRRGDIKNINQKKSYFDLVTNVDRECEMFIRKQISHCYPHHAILGEETVSDLNYNLYDCEYLWIIDPIDGTTNYIHGFPCFTIALALSHYGKVIVGVVYDPSRNELFAASTGQGASLNNTNIHISEENKLRDSLLATGFPASLKLRLINVKDIQDLALNCMGIRCIGSASLNMAYVASGRITGFWEYDLSVWDLAAGSILVSEAGGKVTDTTGRNYHLGVRNIMASNGLIHGALLDILKSGTATSYD